MRLRRLRDLEQRLADRAAALEERARAVAAVVDEAMLQQAGLAGQLAAVEERISGVERREQDLAAREDAVTAREAAVGGREAAVTGREDAVTGREDAVTGREDAVTGREAAAEAREADIAAQEAERAAQAAAAPEPQEPADTDAAASPGEAGPFPFGSHSLPELERLVAAYGPEFPERAPEWRAYLHYLRDFSDVHGRLGPGFDWLVGDVFSELLERELPA